MKNRSVRVCLLVGCLFSGLIMAESESRFFRVLGPEEVTLELVDVDGALQWTNTTAGVTCQVQSVTSLAGGEWQDYAQVEVTGTDVSMQVVEKDLPDWMSFVPGGIFAMGDPNDEGEDCELPCHRIALDAFWVGECETPFNFWTNVRNWALTNGYDMAAGSADMGEHPVVNVNWFDCIKWCNALSEMEGLTPCYYTEEALVTVCKTGEIPSHFDELTNYYFVDDDADGYRLPTEAEWEYAARGGLQEKRFPWGDTITHYQANYNSSAVLAYDTSTTRGAHPEADTAASEVYNFDENGYDACGFSGNVSEWCWDWFDEGFEACSNCSYTGSGPCVCGDGQGDDPCSCADGTVECTDCSGNGYGPDACSDPDCVDGSYECSYCAGLGIKPCIDCAGIGVIPCMDCSGSGLCMPCNGTGGTDGPCSECGGTGTVTIQCPICMGFGCDLCGWSGWSEEPCFVCFGSGTFPEPCPSCGGSGACSYCAGTGEDVCSLCGGVGEITCSDCFGSGTSGNCPTCDGTALEPCAVCFTSGDITCPQCEGDGLFCAICLGTALGPCSVCSGGAPWDMEYYSNGPTESPSGEIYGTHRVTRGGDADDFAIDCRVSARREHDPALRSDEVGFRPVRQP